MLHHIPSGDKQGEVEEMFRLILTTENNFAM